MLLFTVLMIWTEQVAAGWGFGGQYKGYEGEATYEKIAAQWPAHTSAYMCLGAKHARTRFMVTWNGTIQIRQDTRGIRQDDPAFEEMKQWNRSGLALSFGSGEPPMFEGKDIGQVDQRLINGCFPGTVTTWRNDDIEYSQVFFPRLHNAERVVTGKETTIGFIRLRMRNAGKQRADGCLWMKVSGGSLASKWDGTALVADPNLLRMVVKAGRNVEMTPYQQFTPPPDSNDYRWKVLEENGLLKSLVRFKSALRPGESADVYLTLPYFPVDRGTEAAVRALDFDSQMNAFVADWKRELASGMVIETPDKVVNDAYNASLIGLTHLSEVDPATGRLFFKTYGGTRYTMAQDIRWPGRMMEQRGYHADIEQAFDRWLDRQGQFGMDGKFTSKEGVFLNPPEEEGYAWVCKNGWILTGLCDHYKYTRDRVWLDKVMPNILASCDWIARERATTYVLDASGEKPVGYGLLPEGRASDWTSKTFKESRDNWIWSDSYNYLAIYTAAQVLNEIGHPRAEEIRSEAEDYRSCLRDAVNRAAARSAKIKFPDGQVLPWVPDELNRRVFPSEEGRERSRREHNAWSLWLMYPHVGPLQLVPCKAFDAKEDVISWALKFEEEYPLNLYFPWMTDPRPMLANSTFFMIPAYDPHMDAYFERGEIDKYVEGFYGYMAIILTRGTYVGTDHAYYVGAWQFGGVANALRLRQMLIHEDEEKNQMLLGWAMPRAWLEDGKKTSVSNAATYFGPMDMEITSQVGKGRIEAVIWPPKRNPPPGLELRLKLRHPEGKSIMSVLVNGKEWQVFSGETVSIPADTAKTIKVTAIYRK